MQSQGGDPRPSSGDGSLLKTQTVSTACPADPRSTDSLFTLRSLLETLTHRDKSLPALPPVSCKRRLPKASQKTLVSEKEKRKKKAHENASRPCPLSSIASGPCVVHFSSVQTCHPSARTAPWHVPPEPGTRAAISIPAWELWKTPHFCLHFPIFSKFLFNSTKGSSLCLLLFFFNSNF